MKRYLLAALIAVGFAAPASAAQVVWQGDLFVTWANATCKDDSITSGANASYWRVIFRPANVGDNGPDTKLNIAGPRSGISYSWPGSSFAPGTINGTGLSSRAGVYSSAATFLVAVTAPAAPTATTQTVVIKIKAENFFGDQGCTVTAIGSLGLRPGL